MCGITGIYNLNKEPVQGDLLEVLSNEIAHRGPDGSGIYLDAELGLAHRRLAILDVSEKGHQPMSSGDGKWMIVFNGCIYNFKELRKELKGQGHSFKSGTDTEVIAEGLSAYGIKFFERLNGMFAIGAWNSQTRELFLSRDRYGVKPLYYWFNGKTFVFASEIKGIIKHPEFNKELNLDAVNEYFTFQNLFTFQTFFKGITLLPPANTIKVVPGISFIKHHSWWDYDFSAPDNSMSHEEAREGTLFYFEQAVKRQMVSDVPVGAYLSGGMDSGSIAAVASREVNRLCTFTCGFDMSSVTGVEANYDERRDAELMANFLKTEHYEQVINAGDLSWSLPPVVYHLEDLRLGMSYPNYYISRLASKFVKVCLQGTGGDELFGGYPWRYYRVFHSTGKKDFFDNYYGFWQRLVPDNDRSQLFTSEVSSKLDTGKPREIFERVFTFNDKLKYNSPEEHINNSLYFEIKTFLHGLLLLGDKLSMANGLEERFPFLDNDLVEFAQKVPVKYKLGNLHQEISRIDENEIIKKKQYREYNDGKNILRQAMSKLIPDTIINRKKQGFSSPDESWYRGENADYVRKLLLHNDTVSTAFINRNYMNKIIKEHTEQHINHRLLIWSFLCFEMWCKKFLD